MKKWNLGHVFCLVAPDSFFGLQSTPFCPLLKKTIGRSEVLFWVQRFLPYIYIYIESAGTNPLFFLTFSCVCDLCCLPPVVVAQVNSPHSYPCLILPKKITFAGRWSGRKQDGETRKKEKQRGIKKTEALKIHQISRFFFASWDIPAFSPFLDHGRNSKKGN